MKKDTSFCKLSEVARKFFCWSMSSDQDYMLFKMQRGTAILCMELIFLCSSLSLRTSFVNFYFSICFRGAITFVYLMTKLADVVYDQGLWGIFVGCGQSWSCWKHWNHVCMGSTMWVVNPQVWQPACVHLRATCKNMLTCIWTQANG